MERTYQRGAAHPENGRSRDSKRIEAELKFSVVDRLGARATRSHSWPSPQASCTLAPMFMIELIYKAEMSEIDAAMKEHMAFLKRGYAAGVFLVSGRKIP